MDMKNNHMIVVNRSGSVLKIHTYTCLQLSNSHTKNADTAIEILTCVITDWNLQNNLLRLSSRWPGDTFGSHGHLGINLRLNQTRMMAMLQLA